MGCEVAILAGAAVPRDIAGDRAVAVLDTERLRRLVAHFRSAVADLLAAAFPAGLVRSGAELPRGGRRDVRLSPARWLRNHPVLPGSRMACGRRARGGA